jgi:hypothetical protein
MGRIAVWRLLPGGLVTLIVLFGLALRTYHYVRNPSMWHDEAALVLNVLDRSWLELLGPLDFHEAAPPLFLWLERAAVRTLGDSTYALRLLPYLASCAGLLLLADVARRALTPAAVPWAVFLVACSDHLLWHTCEAKPYAIDALAAAAVLAFYFRTLSWSPGLRLAAAAGIAPPVIFLSYPGCFLCGGLLVALLLQTWRLRRAGIWIQYWSVAVVVLAAFALLLAGPARAQRSPEMLSCWVQSWPRWDRPWSIPWWTVIQSLEVFRYAFEPAGQGLCLLAVLGAGSFRRRGGNEELALLITPVLLALLAACLHAYPFGGYRVDVFAAPALALLSAEGAFVALHGLKSVASRGPGGTRERRSLLLPWTGSAALVLFLLMPLARVTYRAWRPWPRPDSARAAAFVWTHRQAGDPVVGNHWEYVYYFRGLQPPFQLLPENHLARGTRFWLATTSGDPKDRLALMTNFPGHWHLQERHDFLQATVFLLSRSPAEAASAPTH